MIKTGKTFLSDDFLLQNEVAYDLYRVVAAQPIIDFHNHLSPKDIAENRQFKNLTEIWLEGDHYKWRAMRANGVDEKYCTGTATAIEKFMKWAGTVPHTLRNPLFHWTHLELKNYFGINRLLNSHTAPEIYEECNALLQTEDFRVQGLLTKMNVEVVCTTDDPIDSLEYHFAAKLPFKMLPTFRPDKVYAFETTTYISYLESLSAVSGVQINSLSTLLQALAQRIDYFNGLGCRAADHGLELMPYEIASGAALENCFGRVLQGISLSKAERDQLRTYILLSLCEMYKAKGWVQQFHLGALRNNNTRMQKSLGADSGFDSIGDFQQAQSLAKFLDHLDSNNRLSKTILYNLNPADNELFATMCGNFNDGTIPGKMQYGAAWWFLDQKDGIEKQFNVLSNLGLLSRFVGMVTDSRSFLSFPRHEYFRRILCNLIGNEVEAGELPDDRENLELLVRNICYSNAKSYFNF
jgi:glucuronate isomerase